MMIFKKNKQHIETRPQQQQQVNFIYPICIWVHPHLLIIHNSQTIYEACASKKNESLIQPNLLVVYYDHTHIPLPMGRKKLQIYTYSMAIDWLYTPMCLKLPQPPWSNPYVNQLNWQIPGLMLNSNVFRGFIKFHPLCFVLNPHLSSFSSVHFRTSATSLWAVRKYRALKLWPWAKRWM